ncbi:hypothetical protein [Deinococcus alpinitundrae]|uniref:hypothetical protein n=1 Tax=Deinococcus alpinitundrae TaxID=468913 RepID=UPI00137A79F6|nr:hypothetical protein [Deinococcus alpinitundrae]
MIENRIGTSRDSALLTQTSQGLTVTFDAARGDVPMFGFSFSLSWAEARVFADLILLVSIDGMFFSTAELSFYFYRTYGTCYFLPLWSGQPPKDRWPKDHLPGGRELPVLPLVNACHSVRVPGEYTLPLDDIPAPLQALVIPWSKDVYGRHEMPNFKSPAIVGFQGYPDVALSVSCARILGGLIRSVRTLSVELNSFHGSVTVFSQPDGSLMLALQASTWQNRNAEKFNLVLRPEQRAAAAARLAAAVKEAFVLNEPLYAAAQQREEWMFEGSKQLVEDSMPEAMN